MRTTVVGLVTPHLLHLVDLANQADKGVNVDWHVRAAVSRTVGELRELFNGPELIAAYIDGLESAAADAPPRRVEYANVLRAAAEAARNPR
ncbi:hypothetical protein [Cognatilysobacter terrigena]|uniref:hypothetical protein n=1 Tax=Cognatilysobacter terrigena TaxID=2488749 RepID=UPI00105F4199|nr:hypothetical protein [Lysobacter terrigena]